MEATRWAAHLVDSEWTLLWVSTEMQALLGVSDAEELGIGRHLLEAQMKSAWRLAISEETEIEQFRQQVPMMIGTGGRDRERVKRILPEAVHGWLDSVEPTPVPQAWTSEIEFLQGDLPPASVRILDLRLGTEAERRGVLRLYGSALPARILALVGRGDENMFTRMARIFAPGERQASILFADLEASGALARRLSSEAFFSLIRELTTRTDALVIEQRGVVGKHVGDGVTAFFLAEDLGSASAAARAAIEVGSALAEVARGVAGAHELDAADCRFNVGLHWGDRLFMGQVVTGGRIEVTALGDAVNRAARLEQCARDGQILASKELVERLDRRDAADLGLAAAELSWQPLAEREGISEKALRDAAELVAAELEPSTGAPRRASD